MTSCRDEIRDVVRLLLAQNAGDTFTLDQVVTEMPGRGSRFSESTIRTHVTSRMRANSPDHHARVYGDFERVDRGVYRLRSQSADDGEHSVPARGDAKRVSPPRQSDSVMTPAAGGVGHVNPATFRDRIGLVGCVKAKLDHEASAADLYVSPLFMGRRAFVERTCERWFILSALHGLVLPDTRLEPYDVALGAVSRAERRSWANRVLRQLEQELGSCAGLTFEIHAGANYADFGLVDGLKMRGAAVERPCAGLGMGQQLAFYAEQNSLRRQPRRPSRITKPQCQECDVRATAADLDDAPSFVLACDWPAGLTCLAQPGLYAWWVDETGATDLSRGLGREVVPGRIYAGQAGATFWPSGKSCDNTLGKRIGQMHLGGKVRKSTFRHTLAAILCDRLNVQVTGRMRVAPASEKALTLWMTEHLAVAVHAHDDRDTLSSLEHAMLQQLDPPFNLSHMSPTPQRARLTELRHRIAKGP